MSQSAFVIRIAPGGEDKVPEALHEDEIIIGWAEARGLLDQKLSWEQFREIVSSAYYSDEPNLRRAGAAGGHMWRFIRDMKPADLVVVPEGAFVHQSPNGACRACRRDDVRPTHRVA